MRVELPIPHETQEWGACLGEFFCHITIYCGIQQKENDDVLSQVYTSISLADKPAAVTALSEM